MSSAVAGSAIDEFRAALRDSANADLLSDHDLASMQVDGVAPELIVAPASEHELSLALGEANDAGLAVIARGGGAHAHIGNVPEAYDVAVTTRRLRQLVAHEPADLTVTVEPGMRLADLQATLAAHNQFLPLDAPGGGAATIGGIIAADAYGPLRHAFGTVRDWLIGVRVVHADGRISKAGGRVVKNVAGYEMTKLYCGSLGTLGVISEATFKLAPLPPVRRSVVLTFHTPHAGAIFAIGAREAGLSLHAMELLSPPAAFAVLGDARWALIATVAGVSGGVNRSMREIGELAAGLNASVETAEADDPFDAWRATFAPSTLSLRISVAPSRVADVMDVLDRRFAGAAATMSATVTAGLIRANLRPSRETRALALIDHARDAAARHGGFVLVDAAPPLIKRQLDVFGELRPDFAIMKRLKESFDPKRTLAPGRFIGKL